MPKTKIRTHGASRRSAANGSRRSAPLDMPFLVTTGIIILLAAVLLALMLHNALGIRANGPNGGIITPYPQPYVSVVKNLTSEHLYYAGSRAFAKDVVISRADNISVSLPTTSLQVGRSFPVDVLYRGAFNFTVYNSTAFLDNVININYVGFYPVGASGMLVFGNSAATATYFTANRSQSVYQPANTSPTQYTAIQLNLTPQAAARGHSWYFCGGSFMTYQNDSQWGRYFVNLTLAKENFSNATLMNKVSGTCAVAQVA